MDNKETVQEEKVQAEEQATSMNDAASHEVDNAATYTDSAATDSTADGLANHDEETSAQLEKLRQDIAEQQEKLLRVQADYDNFRRRSRLEKEDMAKYASKQVVEQLLPVYDNFDRALQTSKDSQDFEALYTGLDMIYRQFAGVLEQEGLKPMEVIGKPFNPEFHQAVMQVETDEYEEGIIVEELQRGYMLKDKVIRPAMVKVSS